jgi:hypothetical protein
VSTVDDLTGSLAAVEVDELHDAALMTRVDRKYVLTPDELVAAVRSLDGAPRALEIHGRRSFRDRSTYFDTADLRTFRDAARGHPRRFKIRTRDYLDAGTCLIELKRRERDGRTTKVRSRHDPLAASVIDDDAADCLSSVQEAAHLIGRLRPTLTTTYRRATMVIGQRVTIDECLRCVPADGLGSAVIDDAVIVETKTDGPHAGPLDRALWRRSVRPARISKYCVGMAALRPELPRNRWNRVLRRHVTTTTDLDGLSTAGDPATIGATASSTDTHHP